MMPTLDEIAHNVCEERQRLHQYTAGWMDGWMAWMTLHKPGTMSTVMLFSI